MLLPLGVRQVTPLQREKHTGGSRPGERGREGREEPASVHRPCLEAGAGWLPDRQAPACSHEAEQPRAGEGVCERPLARRVGLGKARRPAPRGVISGPGCTVEAGTPQVTCPVTAGSDLTTAQGTSPHGAGRTRRFSIARGAPVASGEVCGGRDRGGPGIERVGDAAQHPRERPDSSVSTAEGDRPCDSAPLVAANNPNAQQRERGKPDLLAPGRICAPCARGGLRPPGHSKSPLGATPTRSQKPDLELPGTGLAQGRRHAPAVTVAAGVMAQTGDGVLGLRPEHAGSPLKDVPESAVC